MPGKVAFCASPSLAAPALQNRLWYTLWASVSYCWVTVRSRSLRGLQTSFSWETSFPTHNLVAFSVLQRSNMRPNRLTSILDRRLDICSCLVWGRMSPFLLLKAMLQRLLALFVYSLSPKGWAKSWWLPRCQFPSPGGWFIASKVQNFPHFALGVESSCRDYQLATLFWNFKGRFQRQTSKTLPSSTLHRH